MKNYIFCLHGILCNNKRIHTYREVLGSVVTSVVVADPTRCLPCNTVKNIILMNIIQIKMYHNKRIFSKWWGVSPHNNSYPLCVEKCSANLCVAIWHRFLLKKKCINEFELLPYSRIDNNIFKYYSYSLQYATMVFVNGLIIFTIHFFFQYTYLRTYFIGIRYDPAKYFYRLYAAIMGV